MKKHILILLLISLTFYYSSIFNPIALDDYELLNNLINSNYSFKSMFFRKIGEYYRPLLMSTFYLDFYLWLTEVSFYHLENILLHISNSILIYFLCIKIIDFYYENDVIQSSKHNISFLSALLFTINPLNTESVNWISGRSDLMATFFTLSALILFFKFLQLNNKISFLFSIVLFFLGLLCKESAMAYYLIICFIIIFRSNFSYLKKIIILIATAIPVAIYFLLRSNFNSYSDGGIDKISNAVEHYSLCKYILILFKATGFYIKKLFIFYPLNFAIHKYSSLYVIVGIAFCIILIYFLIQRSKIVDIFILAVICFLPALPVAAGNIAWTPVAERYLYMSTAFISLFIILSVKLFTNNILKKKYYSIIIIIIILTFCIATIHRNYLWLDSVRLYADTVKKSPDFAAAKNEYVFFLTIAGKHEEAKKQLMQTKNLTGRKYLLLFNQIIVSDNPPDIKREKLLNILKTYKKLIYMAIPHLITYNNKIAYRDKNITLYEENAKYYDLLYKKNKEPFYLYKKGQMLLNAKKYDEALVAFKTAGEQLPDNSIYKQPALKLYSKLKQKIDK